MRKLLLLFLFILILITLFSAFRYRLNKDISQPVNIPTLIPSPIPTHVKMKSQVSYSLFVPYWTLPDTSLHPASADDQINADNYDRIIYFGVQPDDQGIHMTETDRDQLKKFNEISPDRLKKLLAVRMINTEENIKILNSTEQQEKVIEKTVDAAEENHMDGIVLDLEISAIPFESLEKKISSFVHSFYDSCKKDKLEFSITIYGDEFYRARPFDMKAIAQNTDRVMVMAYDLHKAKGNPGPNFPLGGRDAFGYDLGALADDFLQEVPAEKLAVVFGLYGYDWVVDDNEKAIAEGKPLTFNQIKRKFVDRCDFKECSIKRDKEAGENVVHYKDKDGKRHMVWFEDRESVKLKEEFLKRKGINAFSYWAYSYF